MSSPLLAGKVAIVTGGGSGLGRAGALALARAGARVAVTDVSADAASSTTQAITQSGGDAIALACDAGDSKSVQAMLAEVAARAQPPDQSTTPVQAVASTTMPNAIRYQANGTKSCLET